jgi:mono/diheme cytochrome c family protein
MKISLVVLGCMAVASGEPRHGTLIQQAPASAARKHNPLERQEEAERAGAKLFARECAACHGEGGIGGLGKAPPLQRPDIQQGAPGALFWVLRNGSPSRDMPSFAHLPEAQRWQIVTYLTSLHPAAHAGP